jgi:hypothetical protein
VIPRPTTRAKLYIAGPYTRPDPVINTHAAIKFATIIYTDTYLLPVVPHLTLLWHMVEPHPLEFWYEMDLHHLARCDFIVRLPGESTGADKEMMFAEEHGIKEIHYTQMPVKARTVWDNR